MNARLLAQLGRLAYVEAEDLHDEFAYPSTRRPTETKLAEIAHLRGISASCYERARRLGFRKGVDDAFSLTSET